MAEQKANIGLEELSPFFPEVDEPVAESIVQCFLNILSSHPKPRPKLFSSANLEECASYKTIYSDITWEGATTFQLVSYQLNPYPHCCHERIAFRPSHKASMLSEPQRLISCKNLMLLAPSYRSIPAL